MAEWIFRIVAVIACLGGAAALLRGDRLHPALEAIRRVRERDGDAKAARTRPKEPKAWKKALAFLLVVIAAVCAMAGGAEMGIQTTLDRRGFYVGCIDGVWGLKSSMALDAYARSIGHAPFPCATAEEREKTLQELWKDNFEIPPLLKTVTVDDEAMEAVMGPLPATPAEKSEYTDLGYETLLEYYSELGHSSQKAVKKLNPSVQWPDPPPGTKVVIPNVNDEQFLSMEERERRKTAKAARLEVRWGGPLPPSVTAYDAKGTVISFAPCSIAASKENLPPEGELKVVSLAENPNYTYTPEKPGEGNGRCILPPGPNNPVGRAWIGLSLPGYGIHGTPYPEQIGRAESHGCFRLANWNAVHFYNLVDVGTPVVIKVSK